MMAFARYDKSQAWENFRRMIETRVKSGFLPREHADETIRQYEADINRYTYLE